MFSYPGQTDNFYMSLACISDLQQGQRRTARSPERKRGTIVIQRIIYVPRQAKMLKDWAGGK
eukprot:12073115-Karenia_brevis.AAC.1